MTETLYPIDTIPNWSRPYILHDASKVKQEDFDQELHTAETRLQELLDLEKDLQERRQEYVNRFGEDLVAQTVIKLPGLKRRLGITRSALLLYKP